MSTNADPVFSSLTQLLIELVAAADNDGLSDPTSLAARIQAVDADEMQALLLDLTRHAQALENARSTEQFSNAIDNWQSALEALAQVVYKTNAGVFLEGIDRVKQLVIDSVRAQYPRIAAVLSYTSVIVDRPGQSSQIDCKALRSLILLSPEFMSEPVWDDLLDDPTAEQSGRAPAILLGLLILAPRTISALSTHNLKLASLKPPPTSPASHPNWRALRARSNGWIPITFPLRQLEGGLALAKFEELGSGFKPELSLSVMIRSRRRIAGGRTVTDFELWIQPSVDAQSYELITSDNVTLQLEPGVTIGVGYDGNTGTWQALVNPRPGSPVQQDTHQATLRLGPLIDPSRPDWTFGPPHETRISARDISITLQLNERQSPNVELVARAEGFALVLTNRWFRSLGISSSAFRDGFRFDLDLEARLSQEAGFSLAVDSAIHTRWHLEKSLGPDALRIKVHSLSLNVPFRATTEQLDVRAEVRAHVSVIIGSTLTLVMDGAGGWAGWWADQPGDSKEYYGVIPPTGLGAELNFRDVISGGGFLEFIGGPNERYAGLMTLSIGALKGFPRWSVTAYGLHELSGSAEDQNRKRSFVIVIGSSFRPGRHLGFGIFWIGAGGLVGINRRFNTDALRERLNAGVVGNVLFAEDPVRNAPVLLGDLAELFPAKIGTHVVGLTMQLGWLPLLGADDKGVVQEYLVRLAIGVLMEFDGWRRLNSVAVLGSLKIEAPGNAGKKFLRIQVDLAGHYDVNSHVTQIDATIRTGRLLSIFKLSGDGALRASGAAPHYLFATLGGFYPGFDPAPANFPTLKRILITTDDEHFSDVLTLSASGYLAVTPCSVQFGAEFTAAIHAGNWTIEGKIGGDALIKFDFFFELSLHGSVAVKYRGVSLLGVSFKGTLNGPDPLILKGEACVSVFWVDRCWRDSFALGKTDIPRGPVYTSLLPILAAEIALRSNLSASDAEDGLVQLAQQDESEGVILSPLSAPIWNQSRLPLEFPIDTFEDGKLDSPQRLSVTSTLNEKAHYDWFSPGAFVELSEAEEMNLPTFERHKSGIELQLSSTRSAGESVDIDFDELRLPDRRRFIGGIHISDAVIDRLTAVSTPMAVHDTPPRFSISDERFEARNQRGEFIDSANSLVAAHISVRDGLNIAQHATDQRVTI